MPRELKIYRIKDFIRKNESGALSQDRIGQIIKEVATAASVHVDLNILLDFRQTTLSHASMSDILKGAMELAKHKDVLTNKIANVVPQDKDRIEIAKRAEAAIQFTGMQYKFFTDFEQAIEWLSDVQ